MSPRNQKDPQSNAESRADQSGLSLTQIAASAAAASSAAFAASYLGVAGTIIGAAVASVVATVASSMYSASLRRSREAVRRTAGQFGSTWVVTAPAPPVPASSPAPVPLQPVETLVETFDAGTLLGHLDQNLGQRRHCAFDCRQASVDGSEV